MVSDDRRIDLVDDGQWHEAVVDARVVREFCPEVEILWRLAFGMNGEVGEGALYWLDDLEILPAEAAREGN